MLALSQTAGYAVLALSSMDGPGGEWRLARHIAEEVGVPAPYLSKILHALARAEIILAKRGYRGGFTLARKAGDISILEIVEAVEDQRWMGRCLLGLSRCTDERACPAHEFWKTTRQRIQDQLQRLTLVEVAKFEKAYRAKLVMTAGAGPPGMDRPLAIVAGDGRRRAPVNPKRAEQGNKRASRRTSQ